MLKTELCDSIGIKYPIIQGAMGPYTTVKLATAVSNAGGLGTLTTAGFTFRKMGLSEEPLDHKEGLRGLIQEVTDSTSSDAVFAVNIPTLKHAIPIAKDYLDVVIEELDSNPETRKKLRVIVTSAGDPAILIKSIKDAGLKCMHIIPTIKHAKTAEKAGVDFIIASGTEGGGVVSYNYPVTTIVLVRGVVKTVKTPVIAAGGFCDGAGLVAALALGAVGIQMGTRFIATEECGFHQRYKDNVLKASERDTLITIMPYGPCRQLKSEFSLTLQEMMNKGEDTSNYAWDGVRHTLEGNMEKGFMAAGQVTGLIEDIPTVKELMERTIKEAEEIIEKLKSK
ncbi:MAG: NAD(P)H-dependent flavin oxidoreductase [Candidatus Lokiarchaeia archaeon]